ncbi:MAG: hypothetical protein M1831_003689 [Alyxoria varia]|nr:MAG: hypothetical protein M1831_003689 [Alyxoria varia]
MVNTITLVPAVAALLTATAAGNPLIKREAASPPQEKGAQIPYPNYGLTDKPICRTEGEVAPSSTDFSDVKDQVQNGGDYPATEVNSCTVALTMNNARVSICVPADAKPEELKNFTVNGGSIYSVLNGILTDKPEGCKPEISFGGFFPLGDDFKGDPRTRVLVDTLGQ